MRHERDRWIPRQSLGVLVSRGEHERPRAAGRPAPICPDVAEPYGADRRLTKGEITVRVAAPGSEIGTFWMSGLG